MTRREETRNIFLLRRKTVFSLFFSSYKYIVNRDTISSHCSRFKIIRRGGNSNMNGHKKNNKNVYQSSNMFGSDFHRLFYRCLLCGTGTHLLLILFLFSSNNIAIPYVYSFHAFMYEAIHSILTLSNLDLTHFYHIFLIWKLHLDYYYIMIIMLVYAIAMADIFLCPCDYHIIRKMKIYSYFYIYLLCISILFSSNFGFNNI